MTNDRQVVLNIRVSTKTKQDLINISKELFTGERNMSAAIRILINKEIKRLGDERSNKDE